MINYLGKLRMWEELRQTHNIIVNVHSKNLHEHMIDLYTSLVRQKKITSTYASLIFSNYLQKVCLLGSDSLSR